MAPSVVPSKRKAVIRELVRGRELVEQLGVVLGQDLGGGGRPEKAQELVEALMDSFSTAFSALGCGEAAEHRRDPGSETTGGLGYDRGRSQTAGGKGKARPAGELRRGQTRRSQPYACTRVTSKTLEDGHTWRKYGQKDIHGAKYPRCYFRCTYKHDQGCLATRQVQKSEADPSTFVITYLGRHTCKKLTASLRPGNSFLISFGSPDPSAGGGQGPRRPAAPFPTPKQDPEDDALSGLSHNNSSPGCLTLPEPMQMGTSAPTTGICNVTFDAGDVTSAGLRDPCVSPGNLGVGFSGDSFEFEDVFGEFTYELFQ
uniref:Putative WRKY transcription factor 70 n=1 Tax=Anthurium amnicola TaxID=1678845 RepID=A0A1D1YAR4_9ARAE